MVRVRLRSQRCTNPSIEWPKEEDGKKSQLDKSVPGECCTEEDNLGERTSQLHEHCENSVDANCDKKNESDGKIVRLINEDKSVHQNGCSSSLLDEIRSIRGFYSSSEEKKYLCTSQGHLFHDSDRAELPSSSGSSSELSAVPTDDDLMLHPTLQGPARSQTTENACEISNSHVIVIPPTRSGFDNSSAENSPSRHNLSTKCYKEEDSLADKDMQLLNQYARKSRVRTREFELSSEKGQSTEDQDRQLLLRRKCSIGMHRDSPWASAAPQEPSRHSTNGSQGRLRTFVPHSLFQEADDLIKNEVLSLRKCDHSKGNHGEKQVKGEKEVMGDTGDLRTCDTVEQKGEFDHEELNEARNMIKEEIQSLHVAMGHEIKIQPCDDPTTTQDACLGNFMIFPGSYRYNSNAGNSDQLAALKSEVDVLKKKIDLNTKKVAWLEQKIEVLTHYYKMRGKLPCNA